MMNNIPTVLTKYFTYDEIIELVNMNDLLNKCEILVNRLFADIYDKEGQPYINHLYRVAEKQLNTTHKAAGLLHDTVEDIEQMSVEVLRFLRIPEEVIEILLLVTKTGTMTYDQEISRIISSGNIGALNVKYADIMDNSDQERLNNLDKETKERLENQYAPQLIRLRRVFKMDD